MPMGERHRFQPGAVAQAVPAPHPVLVLMLSVNVPFTCLESGVRTNGMSACPDHTLTIRNEGRLPFISRATALVALSPLPPESVKLHLATQGKGIGVALDVGLARLALQGAYDAGVMMPRTMTAASS